MGMNWDAVVIGAGAGGAATAWRLTTKGLRVLLLEAGPRFDPITDYRLDEPGWERRSFPEPAGSRGEIEYGNLGALSPAWAHLSSFNRARPSAITSPHRTASAGYAHVMGVGGSTLHFTGEAHRLHPDSFQLKTKTGQGWDWPLSYNELEPFYDEAEALIGVAGLDNHADRWRSQPYRLPAHPLSTGAVRLAEAAGRLGWHWGHNPRAALSQPYNERPACNYCGQCVRGCPIGDKGSADVTFLAAAMATGLLTIKDRAAVVKFHLGANARIIAVDHLQEGQIVRQETPLLFLAAGAVQTPRLLLSQHSADMPMGLANSSGQVGRNFMETLFCRVSGLAPDLRRAHLGLPADAISWQFNAPNAVEGAAGGFRMTNAVIESGLNGPIQHSTRLLSGFGVALKESLRQSFGSALSVGAVGAVIPDERSAVTLSTQRRDAFGLPLPVIHSVLTENSLYLLENMRNASRALLDAAGVPEVLEQSTSWDDFSTTHVFGTCRMGSDPANSVVDRNSRSHDHPNLFITDASIFPSTGGGESPSLTISALALKTVDTAVA